MSGLTILTFGGFEVWRGSRRLADFESWKVCTLGAYLVSHRGQDVSRDRLASFFWPERAPDAARRNLRQALYNLRNTLEDGVGGRSFVSDARRVRFESSGDDWLDLDAFEGALDAHSADGNPTALSEAARLYRGDFLAGVQVGENLELEEWLVQEQERLRDAAVAALRELVDHYLATGGYSLGVHHARRLLRIDPLSEESHRKLMRLYALSGRRSRALAQFEELRRLLDQELGVAPLAESEALCREIRDTEIAAPAPRPRPVPAGPVLPLAGRQRELARLRNDWDAVLRNRGRVTWIEGEPGVGTTRLARSALHGLGAGHRATVLLGRHFGLAPAAPYGGLREAVEGVLRHEAEAVERLVAEASEGDLQTLCELTPRIADVVPRLRRRASGSPEPLELAAALGRTLHLMARRRRPGSGPGATVLFLDDVGRADPASLEALDALGDHVRDRPVWILLTSTAPSAELAERPGGGRRPGEGTGETIELARLGAEATAEIARALVREAQAPDLAGLLERQSGGLPLMAAEVVNLLWDLEFLELRGSGWALSESVTAAGSFPAASLEELVETRFQQLPPSARRLVALAAVVGPRFGVETLCAVEGEDPRVVEASLHLLFERWWFRLHLGYWADSRQDRDLTLWTGRARAATFEFAHESIRRAVYGLLEPDRRKSLHRKVHLALEQSSEAECEELFAYHAAAANEPS